MVPPSLQSGNLGLGNAKQFIETGQYTTQEERINQNKLEVVKRINGDPITFEIYDNVETFEPKQWKRVVAVFLSGNEWQFKRWPHK